MHLSWQAERVGEVFLGWKVDISSRPWKEVGFFLVSHAPNTKDHLWTILVIIILAFLSILESFRKNYFLFDSSTNSTQLWRRNEMWIVIFFKIYI